MGGVINRGTKDKPLWYVRFIDTDGRRKQRKTGAPTKALARRVLDEVKGRIALGKVGVPDPTDEERLRQTRTVGELAERFLADYVNPRLKNPDEYRRQVRSVLTRHVLPAIGHLPAASVRRRDVEAMRDRVLRSGRSKQTTVHALNCVSRLYRWAIAEELINPADPCAGVVRPSLADTGSTDYLDAGEVSRLMERAAEHAPPLVHAMIATSVYQGLRRGEMAGLRWRDVDFSAQRLTVARSYRSTPKSDKVRYLPLHGELAPILRVWRGACPETSEGLVFPVEGKTGLRMLGRNELLGLPVLLRDAGCHVPDKPWHALRHTFAAHATMSGIKREVVQALLGHASPEMTQRYAHLAPDYMGGELARLSFPKPADAKILPIATAR